MSSSMRPSASAPGLELALELLERGRSPEAADACRELLRREPRHPDALHLLGVIALRDGAMGEGLTLIERSLTVNPAQPHVLCSQGNALLQMGRPEAALASYRAALRLSPNFPGAHYLAGNVLLELGRLEEALTSYERAVGLEPGYGSAHQNRGHVLALLGRKQEALASYDRALALNPESILALCNRARLLRQLGRPEEALQAYDRLMSRAPDREAALERAALLLELRRWDEAIGALSELLARQPELAPARALRAQALLERSGFTDALADCDALLALDPRSATAHVQRGASLLGLERALDALASFELALGLEPQLAAAVDGRSMALRALDRHAEAFAASEQARALAPESTDIGYRYAVALRKLERHAEAEATFAQVLSQAPDYDYALGNLLYERLQLCDWREYAELVDRTEQAALAGRRVCPPGAFLSICDSPAAQRQCARTFMADKHPRAEASGTDAGAARARRRLRIAYFSADFRDHPVSQLLVGVLEQHDRSGFETLGIALKPTGDSALAARVRSAFDRFIDVSELSAADARELLGRLQIDIAVDLMGHSAGSRLRLLHPRSAPLQVAFLGYPGTAGSRAIDYLIADPTVIPPLDRAHYDEQIVYLPHSFQPNDSRRQASDRRPTRSACGLPDGAFVFCCFNGAYKIAPPMFDVWMGLLRARMDRVLWLAEPACAEAVGHLRGAASARGVDPARLIFAPRLPQHADHLARYPLADLFLDTLPFNAHTTASDALWSGVPLLTCAGRSFAGRVAASLLETLGCPELVTHRLEDYAALAEGLARTPERLQAIRARLASVRGTTPLFDTSRYCRHLEDAYRTMWGRFERGERPSSFRVSSDGAAEPL